MLLLARIMWSQWLLLALSLCAVQAATRRRTTTPRSATTRTTAATTTADRHQHVHHWPPLVAPPYSPLPDLPAEIRLIDGYDQRTPDGEHEFRYELSNGDTRYERTYWLPVGKGRVLARRGFYSVPLPNSQYSTVYYRADHQGYHVETNTLSEEQPLLPRSLDVAPLDTAGAEATKRNSISVPERNDSEEQLAQSTMEPNADGVDDDVVANGNGNRNGNGNGNGNVNESRVRYPSKVKVQTELELAIVNKTKDFENILASQVGSEIAQEQLHADDDDDDDDDDGDMLAHDDDSRLN